MSLEKLALSGVIQSADTKRAEIITVELIDSKTNRMKFFVEMDIKYPSWNIRRSGRTIKGVKTYVIEGFL